MDVEWLGTFAAYDNCAHVVVAGFVVKHDRRAFGAGQPLLAPRSHGGEHRVHGTALVGKAVLVTGRVVLVLDLTKKAFVDEAV